MAERTTPYFNREYKITYKMKTGNEYIDTDTSPIDWEIHFVEHEVRERISEMRVISLDEWTVYTREIEAFKIERGKIVKTLPQQYSRIPATKDDLIELGFEGEELEKELALLNPQKSKEFIIENRRK